MGTQLYLYFVFVQYSTKTDPKRVDSDRKFAKFINSSVSDPYSIESGSSQKSHSGSRRPFNPLDPDSAITDPDPEGP